MMLQYFLVAGLLATYALALPDPGVPSSRHPDSLLERTKDNAGVSYRIERRGFEPDRPAGEPAPRPETVPRPEGNLGKGGSGLTLDQIAEIHDGKTEPQYQYTKPGMELTEEPKPGDGKSGVYDTKTARQVWMTGVKIRVVRQAKAILAKVSVGLYNPGFDLSALSKKDAAEFRSFVKETRTNPRFHTGEVPWAYIDAKSGKTIWSWRAAGSPQAYPVDPNTDFLVEIDGKVTNKGQFLGKTLDHNGAFDSGDLKGWKLRSNGFVSYGPFEGNTLDSDALVVDGPLKGWKLKPDGTILGPRFMGSKMDPHGIIKTGPGAGYAINPDGVVLDGRFKGQTMDTEGFFTRGAVQGFKVSPSDGTITSPDNFKGLMINLDGSLHESGGRYDALDGFHVKSDGTTPVKAFQGIKLIFDGDTLRFTGALDGFKLGYPQTNNKYLDHDHYYFTREGTLSGWVLRSDGTAWKSDTMRPWFRPLEVPSRFSRSADAKFDMTRDKFDWSPMNKEDKEWNDGIDKIAADLKKNPSKRSPLVPPSDNTKLKRGDSVLTQISVNSGTISTQSNNNTNTQSQIEEYIAFYTACQANVTALIWPTLLSLLASPSSSSSSAAAQSPLLQLAAASIYVDLTRSNMLISGPFWQGMYDFSNFTVDAMAAANVSQAEITAMNSTNNQVASRYLQAWGNATRLLNATTLEKDMDLVAPYLNPNDTSLLPQDWTDATPWDPNMDAFFPNTTMS